MNKFRPGALVGPNNIGKQQTIKQLSQACGQHLHEIFCSDSITSQQANWFVKGIVYSDSWILFNKAEKLHKSKKKYNCA